MSAQFYLAIACLAAVSYGSPTPRIVDGESAKIGEFPYMISMRLLGKHFCGGSIINRRHILTAAHCVETFVDSLLIQYLSVHAGTNFLNETGDAYDVEEVIPHPDYDTTLITNDIALLRLKKDIQYKDTVKAIYPVIEDAKAGDPCTLSGWGDINNKSKQPNDLQKLNSRVFSQTECDKIWSAAGGVPDTQVCAFSRNGQGMCSGDSGSPLVWEGAQIGIASYTSNSCAVGKPDVYTRVSAFKEWIDKHTKL